MASNTQPESPKAVEETLETKCDIPRSRSGSPIEQDESESSPERFSPVPSSNKSGENRLRPAGDIINRIIWDENYSMDDYVIVFLDRFEGELQVSFNSWKKESTHEEFIPQHRVLFIKHINGDVVWDRRRRIDTIFNSGNSAFSELAFLY